MTKSTIGCEDRLSAHPIDLEFIGTTSQTIELTICTSLPAANNDGDRFYTKFDLLSGRIEHHRGGNVPVDRACQIQALHHAQLETIRSAIQSQTATTEVIGPPPPIVAPELEPEPEPQPEPQPERILVTAGSVATEEEWETWDETPRPLPIKEAVKSPSNIPDWEEHFWEQQTQRAIEPSLLPAPATIIDGSATAERWEKFVPECVGFNTPDILPPRRRSTDIDDLEDILSSLSKISGIEVS
jgi:hypothetical protein